MADRGAGSSWACWGALCKSPNSDQVTHFVYTMQCVCVKNIKSRLFNFIFFTNMHVHCHMFAEHFIGNSNWKSGGWHTGGCFNYAPEASSKLIETLSKWNININKWTSFEISKWNIYINKWTFLWDFIQQIREELNEISPKMFGQTQMKLD